MNTKIEGLVYEKNSNWSTSFLLLPISVLLAFLSEALIKDIEVASAYYERWNWEEVFSLYK